MRIAFVADVITYRRGSTRFLLEVLSYLTTKYNHDIFVIGGSVSDDMPRDIQRSVKIIDLKSYKQGIVPSKQPQNILRFLSRAFATVNRLDIDIEHLNHHFPIALSYFVKPKCPIICSIHHLEDTYQGALCGE